MHAVVAVKILVVRYLAVEGFVVQRGKRKLLRLKLVTLQLRCLVAGQMRTRLVVQFKGVLRLVQGQTIGPDDVRALVTLAKHVLISRFSRAAPIAVLIVTTSFAFLDGNLGKLHLLMLLEIQDQVGLAFNDLLLVEGELLIAPVLALEELRVFRLHLAWLVL